MIQKYYFFEFILSDDVNDKNVFYTYNLMKAFSVNTGEKYYLLKHVTKAIVNYHITCVFTIHLSD